MKDDFGILLGGGQSIIYYGDCREQLRRVQYSGPVCVVSDPPFNIGYHYRKYKDSMNEGEYFKMLEDIFLYFNSPFVVIHYPEAICRLSIQIGRAPSRVVSWVYPSNTRRQHRSIAFFGISPDFKAVRQPYKNPNDKRVRKLIENGSVGAPLYDWWEVNQVKNVSKEKTRHPCQMPVEVMDRVIGVLPENMTIIDPFMGSGTTGVSCIKAGRKFIGIENDDEYFKIARDRLLAISRENGGKKEWKKH